MLHLTWMNSCVGKEGLDNPHFLQRCHLAGRKGPELAGLVALLLGWAAEEAERTAGAAAAVAAGRMMVEAARSVVLVEWRCPWEPCLAGW